MKKKLGILLSAFVMIFAVGCDKKTAGSSSSSSSSSIDTTPQECEFCNSKAEPITYPEATAYTPTTFSESSYSVTLDSTFENVDGIDLYRAEYELTNAAYGEGHITAYVTEVDLSKITIVAGSPNNSTTQTTTAKIVDQVTAWQNANRRKVVYAATNADFFGNSKPVNAFVKDGVIVKSTHNYDRNDLPVSSPMLFGVSGNQAQIAPMTKSTDRYTNVDASLTYGVEIYNYDCSSSTTYDINKGGSLDASKFTWIYSAAMKVKNRNVVELTADSNVKNVVNARVTNKFYVSEEQTLTPSGNVSYLVVPNDFADISLNTQMTVGFVKSPDGQWDYYDTILGGRHSLVEQGVLAPTVSQESSNGAKNRVPRTAIGIKNDGKVMVVSIEDLEYGSKAPNNTGVNLTELADFMRYYGAYNAMNFDGGGSTQLLVNVNGVMSVKVRSSDYGTAYVNTNSRKVINTLLVVSK